MLAFTIDGVWRRLGCHNFIRCFRSVNCKTFVMVAQQNTSRTISKKVEPNEQMDGEGARVFRSIGTPKLRNLDPFLMLDEFNVKTPGGFPNHPHRGFETVTYMLEGYFRHEDNHGHSGVIGPGDLQWMTAGRGIIHSEMPHGDEAGHGLQLWVNLAAKDKMVAPQYQELSAKDIPEVQEKNSSVKVIAGRFGATEGKVYTRTPSMFLDIRMATDSEISVEIPYSYQGFVYIIEGECHLGRDNSPGASHQLLVLSSEGDGLFCKTINNSCRLMLVAGQPLHEPIVQYGPFVMTSQEEIMQAFRDYQGGKF
eukprot:jgi/Galph1/3429/GphlegSOOS_G2091.1